MHNGYIESYYTASANIPPARPSLDGDLDVDVCVIGGGYTGISAALHLSAMGYTVAVLEAERVGWGASGRNGGHVGVGQRKWQTELEEMLGEFTARTLWDLSLEAVELVRNLIATHNISCDLKQGILHVAAKKAHAAEMQDYCRHLQTNYGSKDVRYVSDTEVRQMIGTSRPYFGGQLDEASAHLHPLKYVLGLAAAAEQAGARIFEYSRVESFQRGPSVKVSTDKGVITARHVVIGCNGYLESLNRAIAGQIMPINNFILATEPLTSQQARELIRDDVAVADTLFVINYWKLSADNRLLFGGGENYTKRFPRDIKSFVRKYMLRIYPQLESTRIDYAWGGTLAVTMNRLPSYGRLDDNIYYAQGFSGHGVPTSTMAGKLMAEAIDGQPDRFDVMANLPTLKFPGGVMLRWPGLVAGMAWHAMLDRL